MIIKVSKPNQFEVIPRTTLQDARLRLDELGLLVRLLSRPNGWAVRPAALQKETGWGRERLGRVLAALERAGYLKRTRTHDDKTGKWVWQSELYAESEGQDFHHCRVTRRMVHPSMGEPSDGKPGDIDSTEVIDYRSKIISSSSNPDLDDDKKLLAQDQAREEDEYIDLAMRHGNITDPVGFEIAKRREWAIRGGLSELDKRQLEHRRRLDRLEPERKGQKVSNDIAALMGLALAFNDEPSGQGGLNG